jgi:hypothetical protein
MQLHAEEAVSATWQTFKKIFNQSKDNKKRSFVNIFL